MLRLMASVLAVIMVAVVPRAEATEGRVALVIGIGAYQHLPRLDNPPGDAELIATTLKGLGFTLIGGKAQIDLDKPAFEHAIREFGAKLVDGSVGLFYYAGHGVQVQGGNYLIPVGANPTSVADVDYELIDAELVLKQMRNAGSKLNFVILDACRNNPFGGRGLRDSSGGLAQMQAPSGTLISYATQPGNVALDGNNGHSPYTQALAEAMQKPGLGVFSTFNEVAVAVDRETLHRQQPWQSSSPISGDFYFVAPASPAPNAGLAPLPADAELLFWQSIASSSNGADFDEYLRKYPNGQFSGLAHNRLAMLRPPAKEAAPAPASAGVTPPAASSRPALARQPFREQPAAIVYPGFGGWAPAPVPTRGEVRAALDHFADAFSKARQGRPVTMATNDLLKLFGNCFERVIRDAVGDTDPKHLVNAAIAGLERRGSGSDEELIDTALNAMLHAVDPHSNYLTEANYNQVKQQTQGQFGGIGIEVAQGPDSIRVVSPFDGTPAGRAGIKPGDLIIEIDGVPLRGMSLAQAGGKLRGPVNTKVVLTMKRGDQQTFQLTLIRETITQHPVRWHLDGGDIGYVRVTNLNERAAALLENAIKDLKRQSNNKLAGIVLDLRNDPGGLLDEAIKIADAFLDKGDILTVRGRRDDGVKQYSAHPGDISEGVPLVVMINHGTASGSEVIAAALHDNHRATILGTPSFGRGSIQTIFPFPGHGALRLTTALNIAPAGELIQGQGVTPDRIVELGDAPAGSATPVSFGSPEDHQYVAAIEVVRALVLRPAAPR